MDLQAHSGKTAIQLADERQGLKTHCIAHAWSTVSESRAWPLKTYPNLTSRHANQSSLSVTGQLRPQVNAVKVSVRVHLH
jgi:hypothetical protein